MLREKREDKRTMIIYIETDLQFNCGNNIARDVDYTFVWM